MADRLGVDGEVKDLKLGDTFNKNYKDGAFHAIRYDFKPASVDKQKMGTVEVEGNKQVTVTVPHVEGAGTTQTVFKGNHKAVAKECILIIDHTTGEIVLERISHTINVKTTRPEGSSRVPTQRPPTPLDQSRKNSPPRKCSPSHPRGSSNSHPHSRPSPSHVKLSPSSKSSPHARSPIPSKSPNNNHSTAPGSMPMLGFEDNITENKEGSGMSDSSSESDSNSSSSSSSDSDSDSEPEQDPRAKKANGHGMNGSNCLMNDLELSSASEDSD